MAEKTALISVFHKEGIEHFVRELQSLGFTIYASGGTARYLVAHAGIAVNDIAELVGGNAILGHRVVTLSREIHAGLLARNIQEDINELARLKIPRIDLVCADMYPLESEIAMSNAALEQVIEQTDIGGPTLIRSAAKGQRIVICDPRDRQAVVDWLKKGERNDAFVEHLAAKGEYIVSRYCMASADYRSNGTYAGIFGKRISTCKYGENGWQAPAYLYSSGTDDPLALDKFKVVEGMPPSYNNWIDMERLLQCLTHLAKGYAMNKRGGSWFAVAVKHGNPCGAAAGASNEDVLKKMLDGDRRAIFGGLIMTNFTIDVELARLMEGMKFDGIIAPGFALEAIQLVRRKTDKCRFIVNRALEGVLELDEAPRFRYVRGGFLKQPNYSYILDLSDPCIKKYGTATASQEMDMVFAWAIGSTSNSNTITVVKNQQLIGNGVGQQDRVSAAGLATTRAMQAGHSDALYGAVAYSDSFFPEPDAPGLLIHSGITAILTSSGSIKDKKTIDLCAERKVPLYMVPDEIGRGFFGH